MLLWMNQGCTHCPDLVIPLMAGESRETSPNNPQTTWCTVHRGVQHCSVADCASPPAVPDIFIVGWIVWTYLLSKACCRASYKCWIGLSPGNNRRWGPSSTPYCSRNSFISRAALSDALPSWWRMFLWKCARAHGSMVPCAASMYNAALTLKSRCTHSKNTPWWKAPQT